MGLGSLGLDPTPITGTDPNEATNRINLHTHTGNPGEGDQIDSVNVINTPAGDITADNTQAAINELNVLANLGRVHVPVRQTVLSGHTGIDGYPDFLVAGSGLSINILTSSTPLIIAFAYNFNKLFGQIDFVKSIDQDISSAWSALPANQTCYLYVDRDIDTGVLTYGYSLLVPVYQNLPPVTPATDQHWFDLNTFYMKRWSGTAWDVKQRVFIGECTTNADSVTSVICYAIRGEYDSGWFLINTNQNYDKLAALGITGALPNMTCYFREESSGRIINQANYGERDAAGWYTCGIVMVNRNVLRLFTSDYARLCFARGGQAGGAITPNGSNVSARIIVNRGF